MLAMQTNMDIIANNLANVNTNGYKSRRISFEDLLYQSVSDRQASREGAQGGMGVSVGRTDYIFAQGDLRESDVDTHMAIEGHGFFMVSMPDGQIGFTRDGTFTVDANGQLRNANGMRLEPQIVIPVEVEPKSLKISPEGYVTGRVNGRDEIFGEIEIARFANASGLTSAGQNLFLATVNSGPPLIDIPGRGGLGVVAQGMLEGSNVSVMNEMVEMINAQRAFESVSKVITTSDEMLGIANAMRR